MNVFLQIQMDTEDLQLTKKVLRTTCSVSFIKLEGCYSCLTGAVLTIEAKIKEGPNMATLECPTEGFFIPLKLNSEFQQEHITIKFDTPSIEIACRLHCTENSVAIKVTGTLDYLANTDGRVRGLSMSYEPRYTGTKFQLSSFFGFGWYNIASRAIMYTVLAFIIIVTMITSIKVVIRKMI